jgi:hypothetical protein
MQQRDEITLERLERALVTMAYLVVRYGAVYAPILDAIEKEIAEHRNREAPVERARRLLSAYTIEGGSKAILSIQSRF